MRLLPKQWKYWCKKAYLKPNTFSHRGKWGYWYLKGQGRHWRVNDQFMFQCGDTYEEFDRWARCKIEESPVPQTEKQFLSAVKILLNLQRMK